MSLIPECYFSMFIESLNNNQKFTKYQKEDTENLRNVY